ncbi:hypothetical protein I7I51_06214 [Histoplasma capsulatum]|uniref:Uncharacterized protein n=1 Tax=Ajellomyces capsulatus TaxID=5037 RepID=A0A8A1MLB1_AJECA|nr:hypothetical protein I7I51_06214 [Histoplasma capsulatum]
MQPGAEDQQTDAGTSPQERQAQQGPKLKGATLSPSWLRRLGGSWHELQFPNNNSWPTTPAPILSPEHDKSRSATSNGGSQASRGLGQVWALSMFGVCGFPLPGSGQSTGRFGQIRPSTIYGWVLSPFNPFS